MPRVSLLLLIKCFEERTPGKLKHSTKANRQNTISSYHTVAASPPKRLFNMYIAFTVSDVNMKTTYSWQFLSRRKTPMPARTSATTCCTCFTATGDPKDHTSTSSPDWNTFKQLLDSASAFAHPNISFVTLMLSFSQEAPVVVVSVSFSKPM